MKPARTSAVLALAAVAAFASPLLHADESSWYAGIDDGRSRSAIDDEWIVSYLLAHGFTTTSIIDEDRDTSYQFFVGYRVNDYFGLEGGYFDLGRFGFFASTIPAGTRTGDVEVRGLNLDAVGHLPITDKFSAFARLGMNRTEARDFHTGAGSVMTFDSNPGVRDTNIRFGVGVQYDFTGSLGMRIDAERHRIDGVTGNRDNVSLVSVGLVYRSGKGRQSFVARDPTGLADTLPPATVAVVEIPFGY